MARPKPTNQAEWEQEGAEAILDLVHERLVVPIPAIEAQIAIRGWKDFHRVQPVQLTGARRRLVAEGLIEEDTSHQHPAVTTARIPIPEGRKREIERLRGSVRKSYRKYLSWSGDHLRCGKHAEKVVLDSLTKAATDAGLYIPPQAIGNVREVHGAALPGALTLDAQADILRLPEVAFGAALVVEVKNIHSWIYPSARELWELLVKAAPLAEKVPVVPLLVCARTAYPAGQMAKDVGFFVCQMSNQIFSPSIDETEFADIINRFGLAIERHEGPLKSVVAFLTKVLRLKPPSSPPEGEDVEWYQRQADRFRLMADVILRFEGLAGNLEGAQRAKVFRAFKTAAAAEFGWPSVGGY